jgi:hypothetical protein
MAKCDFSIEIGAPIDAVFALTQDPSRRKEWDFRITGAKLLNAERPNKGVRMRSEGRFGGAFAVEMEYVAFEPGRGSAVKVVRAEGLPFIRGGGSWKYENLGEGRCRFRTTLQMFPADRPLSKLADRWVLEPFLAWMTRKSLRALKAVAEREAATNAGTALQEALRP